MGRENQDSKSSSLEYIGVDTIVVAFQDFLKFSDPENTDTFEAMLKEKRLPAESPFKSIWVVGMSGEFGCQLRENYN